MLKSGARMMDNRLKEEGGAFHNELWYGLNNLADFDTVKLMSD